MKFKPGGQEQFESQGDRDLAGSDNKTEARELPEGWEESHVDGQVPSLFRTPGE